MLPLQTGSTGFTEKANFAFPVFYFPMLRGVVEFDVGGTVDFGPADFMERNSLGPKTKGSSVQEVEGDGVVVHCGLGGGVLSVWLFWIVICSLVQQH